MPENPTPSACVGCTKHDPRRRDFVTSMLLATVGSYFATACGDGVIGGPLGPGNATLPEPLVVNVGDFPELATVGGTARVDPNDTNRPIAVTRTGASSFVALSLICPHQRFKPIQIVSFGFQCPNHGAQFDETGNWVGGQPTRDLVSYDVVYDSGADTLTIT
jgi:nitrite reductase/ring-hydroxylating ferredoxin subunit